MKITSSEFIKSATLPSAYPDTGLPEVAFVGRSNVGKSSLINKLLNRRALAKTSSTPGKTRLVNFFLINGKFVFVDLPGYGYAKVSRKEKGSWKGMMERYFSKREELKGVVLLQDIRREQTERDKTMIEFLEGLGIPVIVVLTKADKFSKGGRIKRLNQISKGLSAQQSTPLLFSSLAGLGKDELWKAIYDLVGSRVAVKCNHEIKDEEIF